MLGLRRLGMQASKVWRRSPGQWSVLVGGAATDEGSIGLAALLLSSLTGCEGHAAVTRRYLLESVLLFRCFDLQSTKPDLNRFPWHCSFFDLGSHGWLS